jgi:hypothetical protein
MISLFFLVLLIIYNFFLSLQLFLKSALLSLKLGAIPFTLLVKAVPLQAWSSPECSSKLRFPDFMTTTQDGGKVVRLTHRPPLPPRNTRGTHFC